jgi:hypothetical protein
MEELNKKLEQPAQLPYSALENAARQLSAQNEELKRALQEMNYTNFFNRLNFLFKVIDNLDKFSKEFAENCVKEIEDLMSLPMNKEVAENDNKESE